MRRQDKVPAPTVRFKVGNRVLLSCGHILPVAVTTGPKPIECESCLAEAVTRQRQVPRLMELLAHAKPS